MTSKWHLPKQYLYYPVASPLHNDGVAWIHFTAMWGLGYHNCDCGMCKRAKEILDEAVELNKPVFIERKWL